MVTTSTGIVHGFPHMICIWRNLAYHLDMSKIPPKAFCEDTTNWRPTGGSFLRQEPEEEEDEEDDNGADDEEDENDDGYSE